VFIAILDIATDAADRPAALTALDAHCAEVRAMPGNIAYRVYASRDDATGITIVHEWEDEASFQTYPASDSFARLGAVLMPLAVGAPAARRFDARPLETAN
jgi:quinol monooxygenase YgiN